MGISVTNTYIVLELFTRFFSGWPWIHYVAEDGLELFILLPPLLKWWGYRAMPPWSIYVTLGTEPRLCILGNKWATSPQGSLQLMKNHKVLETFSSPHQNLKNVWKKLKIVVVGPTSYQMQNKCVLSYHPFQRPHPFTDEGTETQDSNFPIVL